MVTTISTRRSRRGKQFKPEQTETPTDPRTQKGALIRVPNGGRAYVEGLDPKDSNRVLVTYEHRDLGTDSYPLWMIQLVHPSPEVEQPTPKFREGDWVKITDHMDNWNIGKIGWIREIESTRYREEYQIELAPDEWVWASETWLEAAKAPSTSRGKRVTSRGKGATEFIAAPTYEYTPITPKPCWFENSSLGFVEGQAVAQNARMTRIAWGENGETSVPTEKVRWTAPTEVTPEVQAGLQICKPKLSPEDIAQGLSEGWLAPMPAPAPPEESLESLKAALAKIQSSSKAGNRTRDRQCELERKLQERRSQLRAKFAPGQRVQVVDHWLPDDIGKCGVVVKLPDLPELRSHIKVEIDGVTHDGKPFGTYYFPESLRILPPEPPMTKAAPDGADSGALPTSETLSYSTGEWVEVIASTLDEDIGRRGKVADPPYSAVTGMQHKVRVLLDGDRLVRIWEPSALRKLPPELTRPDQVERSHNCPVCNADLLRPYLVCGFCNWDGTPAAPAADNELVQRRSQLLQQIDQIRKDGEVAPKGCWIESYTVSKKLAGGDKKQFSYQRIKAYNPIFQGKKGAMKRSLHLGTDAILKDWCDRMERRRAISKLESELDEIERKLQQLR